MKVSKPARRKAGWREYIQGGVVGGVLSVSAVALASQCIQIDSAPKVADYYNQYKDYRDQYERLMEWRDRIDTGGLAGLFPQGVQGLTSAVGELATEAGGFYGDHSEGLTSVLGGHEISAVRHAGPLARRDWSDADGASMNDPQLCFQMDMGGHLGYLAQTGQQSPLASQCGEEGRRALAGVSVRPSRDGAGIAPNTAQAAEVSRAVMTGEFAMLDVVRGDLAWLRDNPTYHYPYRYPRMQFDIPLDEVAEHSASMQRVAGIMAGRGFAAHGFRRLREGGESLVDLEHESAAVSTLARLSLAYDGLARYTTTQPRIANVRDGLLDIDTPMIDSANEAERYGIGLQLNAMGGVVSSLRVESQQREERLLGTLLAGKTAEGVTHLSGVRP